MSKTLCVWFCLLYIKLPVTYLEIRFKTPGQKGLSIPDSPFYVISLHYVHSPPSPELPPPAAIFLCPHPYPRKHLLSSALTYLLWHASKNYSAQYFQNKESGKGSWRLLAEAAVLRFSYTVKLYANQRTSAKIKSSLQSIRKKKRNPQNNSEIGCQCFPLGITACYGFMS